MVTEPIPGTAVPVESSDARFIDIALLVIVLVIALFLVGISYTYDLWQETTHAELDLRARRQEDATLKEQLARALAEQQLDQAQNDIPRAASGGTDLSFLGSHATVSWTYRYADGARFVTYAVELRKLSNQALRVT